MRAYKLDLEFESTIKRADTAGNGKTVWEGQPCFVQATATMLPNCDCSDETHDHVQDIRIDSIHVAGNGGEEYEYTAPIRDFEDEAIEAAYNQVGMYSQKEEEAYEITE